MASSIITSVVTGGSNSHATVSSEANTYATDFVNQGVLGSITSTSGVAPTTGSFGVNQNTGSDMNVKILGTGNTTSTNSVAYVTVTPSSQDKQVLRARMTADYTAYSINSNSTGSTVYDWIYLQASATNANTPSASADNVITLLTSRSTSSSSDTGSPPTYGTLLAVVTVANGATAITNANISDRRTQVTVSIGSTSTTTGWQSLSQAFTFSSLNGNRSTTITTPNDLTGVLTPGMRMSFARSVTPPTQCTSLNGTTQYYNRTSTINGMTFTNNFVVSAWIKLSSYPAANAYIASRYNGTSGWSFGVTATGQFVLEGFNAGAGNTGYVLSYQSVPLNKWVHVAAQLDMSAGTLGATLNYTMLDGVDVPASFTRAGTNPISLLQAGNLEIGSRNGGLNLFPGKIAQVAIYSAKVTQANIRLTMGQTLAGTETNLISAYSFNGVITDLNVSNANNLTANGGAVATTVDSPFSSTEYAILTSISYSNPTSTLILQSPEGGIIPNQTLSSPQYSTQKVPYGFPTQRDKWAIQSLMKIANTQGSPAAGTWYNLGGQLSITVGSWRVFHKSIIYGYHNGGSATSTKSTLSTANNSESDDMFSASALGFLDPTNTTSYANIFHEKSLSLSTQTTYYMNAQMIQASAVIVGYAGNDMTTQITAECAYL